MLFRSSNAAVGGAGQGYTTLGGQWAASAVVGAETDYALFGYQVPVGTNALPGKTLYITDIRIGETFVTGAAVGTLTTFQWSVAVGSNNVSLATTDGAAAVGPRRIALGSQVHAAAAAVGAMASGLPMISFATPLACPPGCFVHVILKMWSGAATASLVFRGTVGISGYFE